MRNAAAAARAKGREIKTIETCVVVGVVAVATYKTKAKTNVDRQRRTQSQT